MTQIKLSVIMPVYNAERFLQCALESVVSQSFVDFELIIINDGSTDKSNDIIADFMSRDSRIKLVERENKGLIYSLNQGLSLATGQYIARMDADDLCVVDRFEKQIELMDAESLDICGCHFVIIDEDNKKIDSKLMPLEIDAFIVNLSLTVPFAHGSVVLRKEFLQRYSLQYGHNQFKNSEDYALWVELFNSGARFGNVDEFLFKYRTYSASISKSNRKKLKLDAKMISKGFITHHRVRIMKAISNQSNRSLSHQEIDNLIGCILYYFIYFKDVRVLKYLSFFPAKSLVSNGLKFLTRRFF